MADIESQPIENPMSEIEKSNQDTQPNSGFVNSQARSEKICRICFEIETAAAPVISPCECNGSMKFIHENCLKKWIMSKTNDPATFNCDICKAQLRMEMKSNYEVSCKTLKEEIFKILIFPIIILAVTTIVLLILIYLLTSLSHNKLSTSGKVYLSIVMVACVAMDLLVIYMWIKSIRAGCFQLKLSTWKIFNYKDETSEIVNFLSDTVELKMVNKEAVNMEVTMNESTLETQMVFFKQTIKHNRKIHDLDSVLRRNNQVVIED